MKEKPYVFVGVKLVQGDEVWGLCINAHQLRQGLPLLLLPIKVIQCPG